MHYHNDEQVKPVGMQELKHAKEDTIKPYKKRNLWIPVFSHDYIIDLRKDKQSGPKPSTYHHSENYKSCILIFRTCGTFNHMCRNVTNIMEVGNHTADAQIVSKDHAEVKRTCRNVMEKHFVKVSCTFSKKDLFNWVSKVISQSAKCID